MASQSLIGVDVFIEAATYIFFSVGTGMSTPQL